MLKSTNIVGHFRPYYRLKWVIIFWPARRRSTKTNALADRRSCLRRDGQDLWSAKKLVLARQGELDLCRHVHTGFTGIGPVIIRRWLGAVPLFSGELGPHRTQSRLGQAYLHTKWHLSPSSRLDTTDICRKLGAVPP